jgi:quinoprotein glucose dehydrogenase
VALDAETGKPRWRFYAHTDLKGAPYGHCRGVAYYRVPGATGDCAERIFTNTIDARLIAIDARTGRLCRGFGDNGIVPLQRGMSPAPAGYYYPTSAPTIVRGRIVLGGWVYDGMFWGEPSGVIRGFDAVTGKLAWAFDVGHPDRHAEPPAGQYYTPGTPNAWAPMSGDEALGLVYAPLGGASLDYSGAQRRPFDEAYSGAVIALDAETGTLRWKFQTVHHDLWDYDVPAQPTLVDLPTRQGMRHALVQPTKRGEVFVLDRVTGQPIFPVREHRVPTAGTAPGEHAAPTQPFSDALPSFRGVNITEADMWGVTPLDQLWCRIRFRRARYAGPLTPPGLTPNIAFPGMLGGSDWGGVSIDADRKIMIANTSLVANIDTLIPRAIADRMGVSPLGTPGGMRSAEAGIQAQAGTHYAVKAMPFLSLLFAPCQAPPWGRIAAVDLTNGKLLWSHPIGTARDTGPLGLASHIPFRIGTPTLGGSVVTRGGLVFIASTQDRYLRAIDLAAGKVLWRARLPAAGQATPMTYVSAQSGRQFVVQAAGGHFFLGTPHLDSAIIAYALPRSAAH